MSNYTKRQNLMTELEKHFSNELNRFPAHLCAELTSLLAFAIKEADHNADIKSFTQAIKHITKQQGLMSYCSLNAQQRCSVDVFGHQVISMQEHIVFSRKEYLDTLRICDAHVHSVETREAPLSIKQGNGFVAGFVSTATRLRKLVIQVVSAKTGGKHGK